MSVAEWFTSARQARSAVSPAITVLHRWFSAVTAVNASDASTGTTEAASPSSGAASAAWNRPRLKRTAPTGRLTSSFYKRSRSRPSIKFLPSGTFSLKPYSRTSPKLWSTLTPSRQAAYRQGSKNCKIDLIHIGHLLS